MSKNIDETTSFAYLSGFVVATHINGVQPIISVHKFSSPCMFVTLAQVLLLVMNISFEVTYVNDHKEFATRVA